MRFSGNQFSHSKRFVGNGFPIPNSTHLEHTRPSALRTLKSWECYQHSIAAAPGRRDGVRRHDPLRWPCALCLHWLQDGVPTRPARSSSPTSPMWGSSPTRAPWRWSLAPPARGSSPPPTSQRQRRLARDSAVFSRATTPISSAVAQATAHSHSEEAQAIW